LPILSGLDVTAVGSLRDGIRIALGEADGQASHAQVVTRRRAAGAPPVLG
jgi:hypothetical protein